MGVGNKRTLTKTRRKTSMLPRDVDQIKADMLSPRHLRQFKETKASEDLPGMGQHYCVECAKWFETEVSLGGHKRGKPHKRRVKQLKEEPYTQKDAEAAVGLRTDNKGLNKNGPERTFDHEIEMET
ncbi:C2H2 finger domain-containing protein [Colletotrichum truncatum]|uniref:C2H2 finger domain-containing protein n=1 Tax=Colletotrichum truncatum TaxID=5467 RepID=A0ACC3YZP2_COLTU|nr:C2H2 finger domain-containing protein [Colletotrichum truncatum]KAF6790996.1 C2H2 finger domain-containing protein [Colletotrichum truncatum]